MPQLASIARNARSTRCGWLVLNACLALASVAGAQDFYDAAPIRYRDSTPVNCISRLQSELDQGSRRLTHHPEHGYLPAVLRALRVPLESQMLVFSKTSLQVRYINVQSPRAVYFSDDVYVGYCRSGDVLEISAVDPQLGTVFYTLDQTPSDAPRFERRIDNCVMCHSSSSTGNVPGHLVRSLYIDADGQPIFSAGGRTVDHTTPIEQRWGGWYVTGTHGSQKHLGNLVIRTREVPQPLDNSPGHNVTDLTDRLRVDRYLTPHSDLVALLVLEHQTYVHNRLTKANFTAQQVLAERAAFARVGEPLTSEQQADYQRRLRNAADELLDAVLWVDEAPLSGKFAGTSGFAQRFAAAGARDSQGRSLRDFDLTRRVFRYPCSYVINSAAFDALPPELLAVIWRRLWEILTEGDPAEKYAHLSPPDRRAIVEILRDTKPQLPDYWRQEQ